MQGVKGLIIMSAVIAAVAVGACRRVANIRVCRSMIPRTRGQSHRCRAVGYRLFALPIQSTKIHRGYVDDRARRRLVAESR